MFTFECELKRRLLEGDKNKKKDNKMAYKRNTKKGGCEWLRYTSSFQLSTI